MVHSSLIILANDSDYQRSIKEYIRQGMSEKEAVKQAFADKLLELGTDMLAGGVSGAAMSGTSYAMNTLNQGSYLKSNPTAASRLIASAKSGNTESKSYKYATMLEGKDNVSSLQLGHLSNLYEQDIKAAGKSAIRYLNDNDIEQYLETGNRHAKNKKSEIISKSEKPILTSKADTDSFVDRSLSDATYHQTKAFAKADSRMVEDIERIGGIDVDGYYLELNSSDLLHLSKHTNEARTNQINLTIDDIKGLPEYIVTYDDVLNVQRKSDGKITATFGKQINGHSVITTVVSNGRKSLALKTAYILSTSKYNELYGEQKTEAAMLEEHMRQILPPCLARPVTPRTPLLLPMYHKTERLSTAMLRQATPFTTQLRARPLPL